jgi:hypothetical protein
VQLGIVVREDEEAWKSLGDQGQSSVLSISQTSYTMRHKQIHQALRDQ